MSKIHISLVGGQAAPVYLGIEAVNPDQVILVYSDQTKNVADLIQQQIGVNCQLLKLHPVDLKLIDQSIKDLRKSFGNSDILSINLSGGTKPWSLLFYENFSNNAGVSCIIIDQNNLIWNLKSKEYTQVNFDMDLHFKLYGNPLSKYIKYEDYSIEDHASISIIKNLRKFNFKDFNFMTQILNDYPNVNIATGKGGSTVAWIPDDKTFKVKMLNKNGILNYTLKSTHIKDLFVRTGWFELEVASILKKWNKNIEMRMNCIFPTYSGSPKNEIDIIINTGSKILFVECKTQLHKINEIDKFASAVKNYGGVGSKALFVTESPMKDAAIEKCKDYDIMTFCLNASNEIFSTENMLFVMLDNELFNVNPK